MDNNSKFNASLNATKWCAAAVAAQWTSLLEAYQILGVMMLLELFVSSALLIKRDGLSKWCNYMAGWSIVTKIIIATIVYATDLMSDSFTHHLSYPVNLAPWVAMSFSIQQFITIVKKSKGLDVDPPPLVDALLARVEKWLSSSGNLLIEQNQVSPTQTITIVKVTDAKDPLIVPSTDINKGDTK